MITALLTSLILSSQPAAADHVTASAAATHVRPERCSASAAVLERPALTESQLDRITRRLVRTGSPSRQVNIVASLSRRVRLDAEQLARLITPIDHEPWQTDALLLAIPALEDPSRAAWLATFADTRAERIEVHRALADTCTITAAPSPVVVSSTELARMIRAVEEATFDSDQLALIATLARHHHFTTAQVARLIDPLAFDDSRVEAIGSLREVIVDPQNAWQLESSLTFSSSKEELRSLFT